MINKINILVVDDYRENIRALSELIASVDVEIFAAANANEALELIAKHDFGLLLLDVQMPGTSGFELARIIRSVKKYRTLPIIFVTASKEDSSLIFHGYQSGAVDLLFKPLDPYMVRSKVQMFVEMAQQKGLLQSHIREFERLRIEAEAANIAKSQFLANMSHEIRTPLAAVMGFAELIAKGQPDNAETRELTSAVQRNGNLLMRLIDDILDLSKIEAGRLELEKNEFDLAELIRDIDSTLSFRAQEKGLSLRIESPSTFPSLYLSDSTRIKQILLNIIGNAIKFTRTGTVDVKVSTQPSSTDVQFETLTVQVKDQGVGLSQEQAERLFQPFGQADSSTRRQFGGSGLGLVISRQIAQAMGGDIRLLSTEEGKGSVFQIELTIERASQGKQKKSKKKPIVAETEPTDLSGKHILVVDDSPDNLKLISLFLRGLNIQLHLAENGIKAIEAVQKNDFDLILMDVQMPHMDGHEATAKIRQEGFKKPIVALTAHAIRTEHDKCHEAGCDSVLTKPITRTTLLKELHTYLR